MGPLQGFEEEPTVQPRENPHREKEGLAARHPSLAVRREPSARHHAVDMRVILEVLAPRVQHGQEADLRPEVLLIDCDRLQGRRGRPEQDVVDRSRVLEGQRRNGLG